MNRPLPEKSLLKKWAVLAALCCVCAVYFAYFSVASKHEGDAVHLRHAAVRWISDDVRLAGETHTASRSLAPWQMVALPDPWTAYSPQRRGVYEYQLTWSVTAEQAKNPQALYIPRLGNRYQLRLNERVLSTRGPLNDASVDGSHEPLFVALARDDWRVGENTLTLLVAGEPNRFAGLSSVWVGDAASVGQKFHGRTFWQTFLSWVIIFISVSAGVLAWVVAYYSKIPYLIVFGVGSLAWGLRTGFLVTTQVFTDYRVFLFAFDALFALAVGCFVATAARVVKLKSPVLDHGIWVYAMAAPVLSALFALGVPLARTALMLMMLALVVVMAWLYIQNLRRGGSQHSTMLQAAFVMAILFGIYDFVVILNMKIGYELFSLSKFSFVVTSIALASLFGSRLSRINAQLRISHRKINARLSAARQRLSAEYQVRAQQERKQVLTQERWRLMQDMHDGLGGQLVSLQQAVRSPNACPELLSQHVKFALDSLRMTVNALGQNHENAAFMLGSIRERLEFLCQQYGKTLRWEVQNIPELAHMDALKINELEKIVLELFTNIAKHSNATQVRFSAGFQPERGVWLKVQENGAGYANSCSAQGVEGKQSGGKGLKGLIQRAASIDAQIEFADAGTTVSITLSAG